MTRPIISIDRIPVLGFWLAIALVLLGTIHSPPAAAVPPVTVGVDGVQRFSATLRVRARGPSEVAVQVYRRSLIPGARQPRLRYYGRPQVLFFDRYGIPAGGQDRAIVVEGLAPDGTYYYRVWTPDGFVVRGRFSTRR